MLKYKVKSASLFSGIGGFDIAAEATGWQNILHCEWNPFAQVILNYYWPQADSFNDITKVDFSKYYGAIDVISAGFPCQPFSTAGRRAGVDDERYLWPQTIRAIRQIKPAFVVCENVAGILSMGEYEMWAKVDGRTLTRYTYSDHYEATFLRQEKMLVNSICEQLEAESYKVQPVVIPAAGVGAPHRRDRIWIVAYSDSFAAMRESKISKEQSEKERLQERNKVQESTFPNSLSEYASDTNCLRCRGRNQQSEANTSEERTVCSQVGHDRNRVRCEVEGCCAVIANTGCQRRDCRECNWEERQICNNRERNSAENKSKWVEWVCRAGEICFTKSTTNTGCQRYEKWIHEIDQNTTKFQAFKFDTWKGRRAWEEFPTQPPVCGRNDGISDKLDGITISKWREESIKGYGNAIVPQVAMEVFKIIDLKIRQRYGTSI